MKRRLFLSALLLLTLIPSAHAYELKDDLGRTSQWSAPPRRIVSMVPSLTESVCELGACGKLVGVDRYSNYPAAVNALPKLGGMDDTNVEMIAALKPDLVLVAPSSRVAERLQSLGLTVVVMDSKSYRDVQRVLAKLGTLLQVGDAERVWRRIEAGVGAAAQSLPEKARGVRVYYEVASGPYGAGESSFMGEILSRLGARNILPASMGPFPKINPEFVVKADPQVIMMGQRDAAGVVDRPGWQRISAVRDKRICVFTREEGDVLVRPGPRLAEAAQIMARCLRESAAPK
ncbi:ABC transporter substrate-binding protein [Pelomonas sp. KK5]|uniref:ABC transporter substrate-binding protein n=1 Tax=Pelomonas sp. KK5 TaxID=1855730 RepID=UPI00097BD85B|nr:helical backbone metal receptor [Pelomonas sp. KK5]